MSDTLITSRIASFTPLPHRLEYVGEYQGIRFYNDSLATIPEATIHALSSLGSAVATLIAGGYDRHLDFAALGAYLRSHPIVTLILFPDTGKKILQAIGTIRDKSIHTYEVTSMKEAVRLAYDTTPKRSICVLSPASASYNLFHNYEDRGEQFKHWVTEFGNL